MLEYACIDEVNQQTKEIKLFSLKLQNPVLLCCREANISKLMHKCSMEVA